jgi:hypothetical protein
MQPISTFQSKGSKSTFNLKKDREQLNLYLSVKLIFIRRKNGMS